MFNCLNIQWIYNQHILIEFWALLIQCSKTLALWIPSTQFFIEWKILCHLYPRLSLRMFSENCHESDKKVSVAGFVWVDCKIKFTASYLISCQSNSTESLVSDILRYCKLIFISYQLVQGKEPLQNRRLLDDNNNAIPASLHPTRTCLTFISNTTHTHPVEKAALRFPLN